MSHLIESYASSCGLQISKPFINTKYFPVPYEKYIVLHAGGSMGAKRYDYYNEVFDILQPILKKNNIFVIQIGDANEQGINNTVNYRGATSIHQSAYVIQNSLLFIGNDSCNLHFASGFGVPIVGLYGSTTIYNHGPYFSNPESLSLLVGDLKGGKPSYSPDEQNKVINSIKPEEVATSICKLLNLELPPARTSLFFGHQYNQWLIELIPNCLLGPQSIPDAVPLMRMDYEFNEDMCFKNLSLRPYRIATDKPINLEILTNYKKHIQSIILDIKQDSIQECLEFANQMRELGIPYILTTLLKDDALNLVKFNFFDHDGVLERVNGGEKFLEDHPEVTEDCFFRTNKLIFSNEKVYISKLDWQNDNPTESIEHKTGKVKVKKEFFDFAENLYIWSEGAAETPAQSEQFNQ